MMHVLGIFHNVILTVQLNDTKTMIFSFVTIKAVYQFPSLSVCASICALRLGAESVDKEPLAIILYLFYTIVKRV